MVSVHRLVALGMVGGAVVATAVGISRSDAVPIFGAGVLVAGAAFANRSALDIEVANADITLEREANSSIDTIASQLASLARSQPPAVVAFPCTGLTESGSSFHGREVPVVLALKEGYLRVGCMNYVEGSCYAASKGVDEYDAPSCPFGYLRP